MFICKDFNERELLPVTSAKLRENIRRVDAAKRSGCQQLLCSDITLSALTARPVSMLFETSKQRMHVKENVNPLNECMVSPLRRVVPGDRLSVLRVDSNHWYAARVLEVIPSKNQHKVKYDDGIVEDLFLPSETYRIVDHDSGAEEAEVDQGREVLELESAGDDEKNHGEHSSMEIHDAASSEPLVLASLSDQFTCLVAGCGFVRCGSRASLREHMRSHNGQDIPGNTLKKHTYQTHLKITRKRTQ